MESSQQVQQVAVKVRKPRAKKIQTQVVNGEIIQEQPKKQRAPRKPKVLKEEVPQEKWDSSQIAEGQWVCNHIYEKVQSVQKERISTLNEQGKSITTQGDWEKSYMCYQSADHYVVEIPSNKTELAKVLQNAGYDCFTVQFHKKLQESEILDKLSKIDTQDKKQVETLFAGELSTIRGYLKSNENHLGRSLVVNLDCETSNNIRMVDQRTIQFIIIRNVKFILKEGKQQKNNIQTELPNPNLNALQLKPNDIVSVTQYLRIDEVSNNKVRLGGDDVFICDLNLMSRDMYSASVFKKEQRSTITEISQILNNALTTCFTVCFNTNPDQKTLITQIQSGELSNPSEIAQSILKGKETIITCKLHSSEMKLGRSQVIELGSNAFKQVDHRTINWLVFKNVKYFI